MKRLLVLFTNGFPYNISEPFLEAEYPLYREYFDKVLISAACTRGEKPTRKLENEPIEVLDDYTLSKDFRSILEAVPWMIWDKMFYTEVGKLWNEGFSIGKFYRVVVFSLCGNHRALQVWKWLKKHPDYEVTALYSYWLHIPAYAAVRLQQKIKKGHTVSRTHGYDLYAERYADRYMPFQQQLVERLDEVAPISDQGKAYLTDKYGNEGKIKVCRLGAQAHGKSNPPCGRAPLRIVTCSRTIPLKRLDRVVDALCLLTDRTVEWTHIGGGESQEVLEQYAKEKLPANVTAKFTGTIPNKQIYSMYEKEPFHVFLNVSETEGVPVAIMEAMSFGIPVIATNVGGTAELVQDGENGYLMERDFADAGLAELLKRISDMPEMDYTTMRLQAEQIVRKKFDAETNYRRFIEKELLG